MCPVRLGQHTPSFSRSITSILLILLLVMISTPTIVKAESTSVAGRSSRGISLADPGLANGGASSNTSAITSYLLWQNRTLLHNAPPSLSMTSMVYDPVLRSEILFGGGVFLNGTSTTIFYNETWVYSPQGVWYQLDTVHAPAPRAGSSMAYISPPYNEVVLFGGINETRAFGDTWVLNMTTYVWENTTGLGIHPSPRGMAMYASLPNDQGLLLFAGANATAGIPSLITTTHYSDDIWEYTPTTLWKNITGQYMPSARAGAAFSYSGVGSNFVLFGGVTDSSHLPLLLSDTWTFDASTLNWTQQNTTSGISSPFAGCTVYDSLTYENLYIGGYGYLGSGNTTWRWTPTSSGWTQAAISPALQQPTLAGPGCAYDPALNGTVVFGGTNAPQLGGNDFRAYDNTYLVTDVGWSLSYSATGPIVSGQPFEMTARAVNEWGLTVETNVSLAITDSTGTIVPTSIALVNGLGKAAAVVAKPFGSDNVTACLDEICASVSVHVQGNAETIAISPFPSVIQAGTSLNITLGVKNAAGGAVGWWNGTANLTVLPGRNITSVRILDGIGTSELKPTIVGNYTVLVFSGSLGGSQVNFSVVPGPLSNLTVAASSSSVRIRSIENLSITAMDSYGNRVLLKKVNVSDILGDISISNLSLKEGATVVSLYIGNNTGIDLIHAMAENVSGVSSPFFVLPPQTQNNQNPPPSSSSSVSWPVLAAIIIAEAIAIPVIIFRERIFKRKKKATPGKQEPEPVPYLGLLPFQQNEDQESGDEHRR